MRLPDNGVIGVQFNLVSMCPGRFARALRSLATLARSPLCYALPEAVLRSPLAPLARYARSLALVLRSEFGSCSLPTRFARGARRSRGAPPSLRAAPAPPRRFAPLGLARAPRPVAARPLAAAVPTGRAGFA